MELELLTLPEHLSSPQVFSGVGVARSLVLCVCFVDHCLSFCPFSFGHCVVCSSSIYDSDYPFGIFKLFLLLTIVLSVLFRYMNSDYLPLVSSNYLLLAIVLSAFFTIYIILITPLVSSNSSYF